MTNFNTNQTRQFYVASAIDNNVDTNLDIALKQAETGEMYFMYKNADGIVTRSDTFDPKKILSLKKTAAADMAKPLMAHTIAVDTTAVTLANLVGKTVDLIITIQGAISYDESDTMTYVASVTGDSTNTANATAFHKALAIAVAKAIPHNVSGGYPLIEVFSNGTQVFSNTAAADVTGAAGGVVLVEGLQKYVRGKLNGDPAHFSVAFRYNDGNLGNILWGTDTVAASAISSHTVVPANYMLADLEYFALGERGDYYRGAMWPNDYTPTYSINPASGSWDVLTVEYYWQGDAENVQKSPRMIQVASSNANVTTLYNTIASGTISGSGSGA